MAWFFILTGLLTNSCQKENVKPPVLVLAHAGMSLFEERSIYPANSFEAIQYSVDVLGAEGVEIDVQLTNDSVLVLFHDAYITNSPNFNGCLGNHNWSVIKELKHKNSNYLITKLDTVLDYLVAKNVSVYLDIKPYNFCLASNQPLDVIANQIDTIMKNYTVQERRYVIAGSLNRKLLQLINTEYRCFEGSDVNDAIRIAEEDGYEYLMFSNKIIDDQSVLRLIHSPFRWGVFGGKSNGEIRKTISYEPDCFISDNFVFTQKITK